MANVTILGLGAMGSRLAVNHVRAGHSVTVWNRTKQAALSLSEEHGFEVADTPRAAADGANIVVSMVLDDEAAREVWLHPETGALGALAPASIAVESSTISPAMARTLGVAAIEAGKLFLEAPVVGSRPQAEAGALFYLVGGEAATLERAQPLIEMNAGGIHHVGDVGTAATMKLAINGLFGIQVAAYAEIVGLLNRSGIEQTATIDVLSGLPITAPGLQRILGLFAEEDFAPNFPVGLVAKDFAYLDELADELEAEHPITATAADLYRGAAKGPEAGLDIAGIAVRYLAVEA